MFKKRSLQNKPAFIRRVFRSAQLRFATMKRVLKEIVLISSLLATALDYVCTIRVSKSSFVWAIPDCQVEAVSNIFILNIFKKHVSWLTPPLPPPTPIHRFPCNSFLLFNSLNLNWWPQLFYLKSSWNAVRRDWWIGLWKAQLFLNASENPKLTAVGLCQFVVSLSLKEYFWCQLSYSWARFSWGCCWEAERHYVDIYIVCSNGLQRLHVL